MTPLGVRLAAGPHRLTITRGGFSPAPGDGGAAVLDAISLTPADMNAGDTLSAPVASWRRLCGRAYEWIELLKA